MCQKTTYVSRFKGLYHYEGWWANNMNVVFIIEPLMIKRFEK